VKTEPVINEEIASAPPLTAGVKVDPLDNKGQGSDLLITVAAAVVTALAGYLGYRLIKEKLR
jgi:uncharacterized membrane protein